MFGDAHLEKKEKSRIEELRNEERDLDMLTLKEIISKNIENFDLETFWNQENFRKPELKPVEKGLTNTEHQIVRSN